MNSKYKYEEKYIAILTRFKEGNYSKAVEDHNFVWHLLGGEVGKAESLNDKAAMAVYVKEID